MLLGKLLGHRRQSTTAGYAHLADEHLLEAAENVGSTIAGAMQFGRVDRLGSQVPILGDIPE